MKDQINTITLAIGLIVLLVVMVSFWYATLAVAAVTIIYFVSKVITRSKRIWDEA